MHSSTVSILRAFPSCSISLIPASDRDSMVLDGKTPAEAEDIHVAGQNLVSLQVDICETRIASFISMQELDGQGLSL